MGILGVLGQHQRVQFIQNNNTIIQFDASIKEQHSRQSTPTEYPVENGLVISDHVIVKPFELELDGIISDTPIGSAGQLLTEVATTLTSALVPPVGLIAGAAGVALFNAIANSTSPSVAAYGQLLQLQAGIPPNGPQPFDVLTSLYRYPSMWIKSISVPRDFSSGRVLMFTVSLTQLILVSPQSVNVQILANPAVSTAQADTGDQSLGNAFKQGVKFTDTQAASVASTIPAVGF